MTAEQVSRNGSSGFPVKRLPQRMKFRISNSEFRNFLLAVFLLLSVTGCASIGPGTVPRDRFDYITAISDSWKSQMLFNLVKLRYGDAPVFLDVASVINQYLVEGTVGYSGSWAQNAQLPWPYTALYNLLGTGRYAERPTITCSPLSGEKFARSLMTPIPPAAVLNFVQAGSRWIWCCGSQSMPSMAYVVGSVLERECARRTPNFICWWKNCARSRNPEKSAYE